MLFKFWKWRLEVKLKSLDTDNRIIHLSQELLKEVVKSGRNMETTTGLATIQIHVHQHLDGNNGYIENVVAGWQLKLNDTGYIKWKHPKE